MPLGSVQVPGHFGDAGSVDLENRLHLLGQEQIEDDVEPYSVEDDNTGVFG